MEPEDKIYLQAIEFARSNKKRITDEFIDIDKYPPDNAPVSIFMAGSPGAGKTEFSKRVLEVLEERDGKRVIRIDPDELRSYFKNYDGTNSAMFQFPISIIVDKIHDEALKNNQNFIFDGTLSNFDQAVENIERSLRKDRYVEVFFIYQKPELAWEFTLEREKKEGRNIPKEAFVEHFLNSQNTVNMLKNKFGKKIKLTVVVKNIDQSNLIYKENVGNIDSYLPRKYNKNELELILK